jgi:hypothetical protein
MQWKIGISSMFAWAVGLTPFKDTFWSTEDQPNNYYQSSEPYPALQVAVATLSTGPVGPGDMVGKTNRQLVMRCCAADGMILKPSKPAMAIDQQIMQLAFGGIIGPIGEVWTTYSDIGPFRFGIVFAAEMKNWFSLKPSQTSFGEKLPISKIYKFGDESPQLDEFSENHPIGITNYCTTNNFCLYYASPEITFQNRKVVLLGERSKYIPISPQRIADIHLSDSNFIIKITGQQFEEVVFTYAVDGNILKVSCMISMAGTALIDVPNNICYTSGKFPHV